MSEKNAKLRTFLSPGKLIVLLALLLFLYAVLPRLSGFSQSFSALQNAQWSYTLLAAAGLIATYFIASATYYFLAQKPLQYRQIVLVQIASAFTNRLLPAGFGALALNVQFLRKAHHTLPQAIAVASTNNTLGIVGHILVLGVLLLISHNTQLPALSVPDVLHFWPILAVIIVALAVGLLVFGSIRTQIVVLISSVFKQLTYYRQAPGRLVMALLCSMALTTCYVGIFYCSGRALLDVSLPLLSFALVFTGGMIASSATPTPGGLVGAEAGLTVGLIAYGADPSHALAAVLLYRFVTYWLPLLPGFGVFLAMRKLYT